MDLTDLERIVLFLPGLRVETSLSGAIVPTYVSDIPSICRGEEHHTEAKDWSCLLISCCIALVEGNIVQGKFATPRHIYFSHRPFYW